MGIDCKLITEKGMIMKCIILLALALISAEAVADPAYILTKHSGYKDLVLEITFTDGQDQYIVILEQWQMKAVRDGASRFRIVAGMKDVSAFSYFQFGPVDAVVSREADVVTVTCSSWVRSLSYPVVPVFAIPIGKL